MRTAKPILAIASLLLAVLSAPSLYAEDIEYDYQDTFPIDRWFGFPEGRTSVTIRVSYVPAAVDDICVLFDLYSKQPFSLAVKTAGVSFRGDSNQNLIPPHFGQYWRRNYASPYIGMTYDGPIYIKLYRRGTNDGVRVKMVDGGKSMNGRTTCP